MVIKKFFLFQILIKNKAKTKNYAFFIKHDTKCVRIIYFRSRERIYNILKAS